MSLADTGLERAARVVLSHDGSFAGFLCAVAEAINASRSAFPAPSIRGSLPHAELFDDSVAVPADEGRAKRLWERLSRKCGEGAMRLCFEAFCSDFGTREEAIARALLRMSREGRRALDDLADPDIGLVERAAARARAQAHLVTGLLRFSELRDGSWFAPIEPDCDVLRLIGDHFAARYADMSFAIHDRIRGTALLYRPGGPWRIVGGFSVETEGRSSVFDDGLPFSDRETAIRSGWLAYFDAIAIEQRKNPRLQAGHMPRKYWRLLPEMNLGKTGRDVG